MEHRNATAAVIGAGDYIGAAIAKKFAAEGFTICAGRRDGDKLAPLVADVEAHLSARTSAGSAGSSADWLSRFGLRVRLTRRSAAAPHGPTRGLPCWNSV